MTHNKISLKLTSLAYAFGGSVWIDVASNQEDAMAKMSLTMGLMMIAMSAFYFALSLISRETA